MIRVSRAEAVGSGGGSSCWRRRDSIRRKRKEGDGREQKDYASRVADQRATIACENLDDWPHKIGLLRLFIRKVKTQSIRQFQNAAHLRDGLGILGRAMV